MAWLRRILILLAFPVAAFGQGARYDNIVLKPLAIGGVTPVSGALITVCTSAGTGTPCTPKVANIYSDEGLTTTVSGTGGAGTTNSDANGNFGFYIAPGSYIVTVTGTGISSYTINVKLGTEADNVQRVSSLLSRHGTDIGDEINKAYAALPSTGGFIYVVPPTTGLCYNYSTPIVMNTVGKYAILQGLAVSTSTSSNPGGVCLNYTPTTATNAIVQDWTPTTALGGNYAPGGGIRDITLTNGASQCVTAGGCGGSATGLSIGSVNGGNQFGFYQNFRVVGFATGVAILNGASWGLSFSNCELVYNTTGLNIPQAVEVINFQGGVIAVNGTGANLVNTAAKFIGTHFDSNTVLGIGGSGATITGVGLHFENFNCVTNACTHYVNHSGNLIISAEILDDTVSAVSTDYWFTTAAAIDLTLSVSTARTVAPGVTNAVVVSGAGHIRFLTTNGTILNTLCPNSTAVSCETYFNGTNAVNTVLPSIYVSDGTFGAPSLGFRSQITTGWFRPGSGQIQTAFAGTDGPLYTATETRMPVTGNITFSSNADPFNGAGDTNISRDSAGVIDFGTGAQGSKTASLRAGAYLPSAAGASDAGSTALPMGNLWLGTAATNNFKFQPAATAGARVVTLTDPVSPTTVGLPFTIASGTSTLTANAALAAVTSQAAITTAGTGILTTDTITWSYATAPTAGDSLCHVSPYPTAGNVNFVRTNPTAAAQNVSAIVINWRVVR